MSDTPPPERPTPLYQRKPTDAEGRRLGGTFKERSLLVYAGLLVLLLGVGGYMALIERHPLDSPYVIAPAIGALWFGLRLFMIWGSSNAR